MLRLLLVPGLIALTTSLAGAQPGGRLPSSVPVQAAPMNPYASTNPRLNAVRPVLDLLVTLRQLADPAHSLVLTSVQVSQLHELLSGTHSAPLDLPAAERLHTQLTSVLTETQRQQLVAGRAAVAARWRVLLGRARLAAPDGPPQTAQLLYSQWLGNQTVSQLLAGPDSSAVPRLVREAALVTDRVLRETELP